MTRNVAKPSRVADSWVLKGVDPQARQLARNGARRSGVSLSEWLNQVIADAGEGAPPVAAPRRRETAARPAPAPAADRAGTVAARLDALERAVAALGSPPPPAAGPQLQAAQALESAVRRMADEVRESEARAEVSALQMRETLGALWRRVERTEPAMSDAGALRAELLTLAGRLDRLEKAPAAAAAGSGERDEAVVRVLLRIEEGQREVLTTLGAVNTALSGLEHELQPSAPAFPSGPAPVSGDAALDVIEASLRDLDAQVAAVEQRSTGALSRMSDEVSRLARSLDGRVEAVERRAEDRATGLGIELARLAHTVEFRLAEVDESGAALLEQIGGRIAQVAEQLAARMADAEARGAQTVSDGLDKVAARLAGAEESLKQHHRRAALELAGKVEESEARSRRLAEEALAVARRAPAQPSPRPVAAVSERSPDAGESAAPSPAANTLARWSVPGRAQPEPDVYVRRGSPPVLSPEPAPAPAPPPPPRSGARELVESARAAARQQAEATASDDVLLLRGGFGLLKRKRS